MFSLYSTAVHFFTGGNMKRAPKAVGLIVLTVIVVVIIKNILHYRWGVGHVRGLGSLPWMAYDFMRMAQGAILVLILQWWGDTPSEDKPNPR